MSEASQWSKWQEKVANLDHVPGEPLPSTEYLWNRLQQRVQQGKRRRRIYQFGGSRCRGNNMQPPFIVKGQ
jgi:hypothetical protein